MLRHDELTPAPVRVRRRMRITHPRGLLNEGVIPRTLVERVMGSRLPSHPLVFLRMHIPNTGTIRTKIVATIGPASSSPELLRDLAAAGMGIARLNGAHADLDWHAATIGRIRDLIPGVPILFDLPGHKVRTGDLITPVDCLKGQLVLLNTQPGYAGGDKIPVNHPLLHEQVNTGMTLLADDGALRLSVVDIAGRDITCRAEDDGTLRSRMGLNLPGHRLRRRPDDRKDREMVAFARTQQVEFIGLSFVDGPDDVQRIRALTGGEWPRIVAKIETQGGIDHLDEIVAESDALMIDRGDLSAETNIEQLAVLQKHILEVARAKGTPVIVATEMLHSMISARAPTKAEVTDITNAVLDGCSATMLSGETAVGIDPAEAVRVMRRIAAAAEDYLQHTLDAAGVNDQGRVAEATAEAIGFLARRLPITKIVAVTKKGYAPRVIAARQPRQPILAVSNDPMAARSFNLLPGTEGVWCDVPFSRTSTDHIVQCLEVLWRQGRIVPEDLILVCALAYPRSGNRMNLLQTHQVADLITALGWTQ